MKKNKTRILIVEDEVIIANDIKMSLEKLGYSVPSMAVSGEDAIKKAGDERPDLVLMDIVLPGDLDGTETATIITLNFNIPVLFLTAYTGKEILEKVKKTTAYGYLLKPFKDNELHAAIELALNKHKDEIKQRKQHQQLEQIAVERSARLKLFSEIVEKSPVGVQILDMNGRLIYANSALERVYGFSQKELAGKNVFSLNENSDFTKNKILPGIEKTGRWDGELFIKTGEDKVKPIRLAIFTVNDDTGQLAGTIGIIHDLTEEKLAEDELKRHREQLEDLVKERTSELLEANKHLKKEIHERVTIEKKLIDYQKQLQSLTSQMSIIEENEKRRIAAELHDCVGQNLALSKIKLGQLHKSAPSSELKNSIREILGIIEQTIRETRTLTFELSPPILYELGLSQAVKWLIDQFREKHGLEILFDDDGLEKPFDPSIRFFLFQAVRELLVNTVKHAQADTVKIKMQKNRDSLTIMVEDNGSGFPERSPDYSGYGLFNIRERMNHINGSFDIQSGPGRGTRVTLIAPFNIDEKSRGKES